MQHHSEAVLDRYYHPNYCGTISSDHAHYGQAELGAEQTGEVVRVQVILDEQCGRVAHIRFKAQGGPVTVAALDWLCEAVDQQAVAQIEALSSEQVMTALQLPSNKQHCATLALEALRRAVQNIP